MEEQKDIKQKLDPPITIQRPCSGCGNVEYYTMSTDIPANETPFKFLYICTSCERGVLRW
jgi:hypothetical protein